MRKIIPLLTFAIAVAALSGCSSGALPGGSAPGTTNPPASAAGSGSNSGSGTTSATECGTADKALAAFVPGTMSAPYQKGDACYFGVGPNGNLSGATLAQQYGDVVVVQYSTSDVDSQYQAAKDTYGGSGVQKLSGVGTEANYWGGVNDEGTPQVWARTANAFCVVQTHLNTAAEVGLAKPSGSAVISKADMPKLAGEFGSVCSALFGG